VPAHVCAVVVRRRLTSRTVSAGVSGRQLVVRRETPNDWRSARRPPAPPASRSRGRRTPCRRSPDANPRRSRGLPNDALSSSIPKTVAPHSPPFRRTPRPRNHFRDPHQQSRLKPPKPRASTSAERSVAARGSPTTKSPGSPPTPRSPRSPGITESGPPAALGHPMRTRRVEPAGRRLRRGDRAPVRTEHGGERGRLRPVESRVRRASANTTSPRPVA